MSEVIHAMDPIPTASKSFAGRVWSTLSKIDCSNHVEKKGGLAYLSWAWAWGILMENFPESEFEFGDHEERPDGTMQIWVTVMVIDGNAKLRRSMWLPVMDHRNKPIAHPDAFAINTARMRCLTKCLAMFGLGHYIYAGEDLPGETERKTEAITVEHAAEIKGLIEQTNTDVKRFLAAFGGATSVDHMLEISFEQAKTLLLKKLEKMHG
jgi:hypothetical protein